jgi:hypothetical protein
MLLDIYLVHHCSLQLYLNLVGTTIDSTKFSTAVVVLVDRSTSTSTTAVVPGYPGVVQL